jgi:glutamate-1-semialdehyde 2,1-aminomutase
LRKSVTPILYFERAEGPYFYDADGHTLLDYTLGWGPLILGSNHAAINSAITHQLTRGYTFGAQHHGEIELAELITRVVPGIEQVIFSNTGTEAIQSAIRLARATTGRDKIVKFEGHYHGWMNNILVSYRPQGDDPFVTEPGCGGQPASEYQHVLTLPWNDLGALEYCFAQHPGQIACVITEPLLANSGSCEPQTGFLGGLIKKCRRYGALLIFDEIITGFRLALGGAREYYQAEPDLSVYGKALAGGFTLAAVGGRAAMFDVLREGRTIHVGTYSGNPICLAAAIATIKTLAEPGIFTRMDAHGQALRKALEEAARSVGVPLVTCGAGAVFSAHFGLTEAPRNYRDTLRVDQAAYARFRAAMLAHGVHLLPDGRWYVSAVHGERELELAVRAVAQAMQSVPKNADK